MSGIDLSAEKCPECHGLWSHTHACHYEEKIRTKQHIRLEAAESMCKELAKAILSLAESASMSDSFWQTDSRIALARGVLGVSERGAHDE